MDESKPNRCIECGDATLPIRIVDRDGGSHFDVEYAATDAVRSASLGRYPTDGRVAAWLCGGCGRIALYAKPQPRQS